MKIRARLIVAFFIMTIFPSAMCFLCANFILQKQTLALKNSYNLETGLYEFILNPVQMLYNITLSDYNTLVTTADENPKQFLETDYVNDANSSLLERDSFLIIRKNGKNLFVGDETLYEKMSPLPAFCGYQSGGNDTIYMEQNNSILIKQKDFYFQDQSEGQFFLVTDLSRLMPRWRNSVSEIITSFLLIILVTALILLVWIYQGIIHPLNILRIATKQIGNGNLGQPIQILSNNEIGELCQDFEEMRVRLKSMIEGRIQYEEDIRTMLSSISHDLKTPLTAIKGYAEGLSDGVAKTPQMQSKYLQTIYSKANDMTYLVDELSLFAKIEQNALSYHFISLNLAEYFTDCLDDLSLDLESYGLTLSYYNNTDPETEILADPEQLKRVINNITNNACKYMDHSPAVLHVSIEDMIPEPDNPPLYRQLNKDGSEVTPKPEPEEFIKVQIEDEGAGIAAQDLPYIFDRFYRADASRNSSTGGSGLGLSIVKKIVTDHGGKIWAESIEGVGTSILFTLKKSKIDKEYKI